MKTIIAVVLMGAGLWFGWFVLWISIAFKSRSDKSGWCMFMAFGVPMILIGSYLLLS